MRSTNFLYSKSPNFSGSRGRADREVSEKLLERAVQFVSSCFLGVAPSPSSAKNEPGERYTVAAEATAAGIIHGRYINALSAVRVARDN